MAEGNNVSGLENGNKTNKAPEAVDYSKLSKTQRRRANKSYFKQMKFAKKYNWPKPVRPQPEPEKENNTEPEVVNDANLNVNDEQKNEVDVPKQQAEEPVQETKIEEPVQEAEPIQPDPEAASKPDVDFGEWLNGRIESTAVHGRVEAALTGIVKAAGVKDETEINDAIAFIREYVSKTIPQANLDGDSPDMHEIAAQFFEESYSAIGNIELNPKDRIIVAQMVADVMLKEYSPVAYGGAEFAKYADNYALKNKDLIKDRLGKFGVEDIDELLGDINVAGAANTQNEQPNTDNEPKLDQEPVSQPEQPTQQQATQQQATQQQATQQQATQQQPVQPPKPEVPRPRIPDFYNKLGERMRNGDITARVREEITGIIKASSGITDDAKALEIAEKSYSYMRERVDVIYYEETVSQTKMSYDAPAFFSYAYDSLNEFGLNSADQIVTAQKIANVMIKNYSPVAFINEGLDHYADNYVLNNRAVLEGQLDNLGFKNIDTMIAEINESLVNGPQIKQPEPEPVPDPVLNVNNVQEQAVDAPPQEPVIQQQQPQPPKTEPPKRQPQPPKTEPPKQQPQPPNTEPPKQQPQPPKTEPPKQQPQPPKTKPTESKPNPVEGKPEDKKINDKANIAVFTSKLRDFNKMYKLDLNSDQFAASVIDAWALLKSGDNKKVDDGKKIMNTLFKDTLSKAFKIEKEQSYNEHRLPEYVEIVKSSNELMRSAMYGFTDLYHAPKMEGLFATTAFGGLDAKTMADLTVGDGLWKMDQKSDAAWEIQSKGAKDLADNWLKEDKPYEKMINEMKALINENKKGIVSRKEMLEKLTAAEWLLENNEKMMIDDPEDPINKMPNWGNRYWKAIIEARDALGVDKHTSMRDMIQNDYAAMARAVNSAHYSKMQIQLYVLDPDVRGLADSMDVQKEQFATLGASVKLTEPPKKEGELEMTENRVSFTVDECDERSIMKSQPKNYNFVIESSPELRFSIHGPNSQK